MIKLYVGGKESFEHIINCINAAKKHIRINMFIWRDDLIGNEVALALINAANRGVKIYISKDKLGMMFEYGEENKYSFFHHDLQSKWYIQSRMLDIAYPMEGKVKRIPKDVNPNYTTLMEHKNIKVDCERVKMDHSKFYIFDHEILVLGGVNIEDKEVTSDVRGMSYHDYMVEIKDRDVVKFFKQRLYGPKKYKLDNDIEFIFNRNIYGKKEFLVRDKIIRILETANTSVDIVMAYIGDPAINACILRLIKQGVDVNLYIPKQANLQNDLNMKLIKELMAKSKNKLNVYLSNKMIHAKLIRIDDYLMTVGSTNLNNQAMEVLLELNIVLNKKQTLRDMDQVFEKLDQSILELEEGSIKIEDFDELEFNPVRAFLEGLV